MTADLDATTIWRVSVESPRTRGEWFYADFDSAQLFVESRVGRQNTRWRRDRRDKWVVKHKRETWTVEAKELEDTAAVIVDETAAHAP